MVASSVTVTGIFCGSIIAAGIVFFVWELRRLRLARREKGSFVSRSQSIRRLVGATVIIIVALMFFWGVNFLSPGRPLTFLLFWTGVALGALFVGFLGIMDMRELKRRLQDSRGNILNIDICELPGKGIMSDEKGGHK